MANSSVLVSGLSGSIGGRLVPSPTDPSVVEYTFVEFGGTIATLNPATRVLAPRGGGYTELEDIAIARNGKRAFVSERGGTIYELDYTQPSLDKNAAKVVASGLAAPHQLALSKSSKMLYFVEFAGGTLKSLDLGTGAVTTISSGLAGPVGLVLDEARGRAYVTLNSSGQLVAIKLSGGGSRVLVHGLVAPFFLSWTDSVTRHALLIPERDPAQRVRVYDIATGDTFYGVRTGAPFRPSMAVALDTRKVIVAGDSEVAIFHLQPGLRESARLTLEGTTQPFLNTYQRVKIDFGSTGLTLANVAFKILGGVQGGQVSLSRDSGSPPANPEVMLLVGCKPGPYKLQMIESSTQTLIAEAAYTITDVWADPDVGPSLWGQGEFKQFVRNAAWGGGPSGPQNINVVPASGTRQVCIVMVETNSTPFPSGAGFTAIRDRWFNESVGGVVGADGITRSTKIYYENMSQGAFSIGLVGNQVFGPAVLPNAWSSYMTLEASTAPPPAPQNTTVFDPSSGFASAVVASANALLDGSGNRLIDFSVVQSLIMVVKSNGAQFVWPQAWGETFNIIKLDGTAGTISVPVLVMPDDWNPTHASREIHETLAHELGHNLGLGDQYPKANFSAAIAARDTRDYELMSLEQQLPFVTAAHRMMLGWVQPAWVRSFDFSSSGARDETLTLSAIENGAPPAGQFVVIEVRIADGHNYYFEYRRGQVTQIGDRQLGTSADTAAQAVLGTDVMSDPSTAPYVRPVVLRLRKDEEGENSFFVTGQNYKETDTDEPSHFAPADFQMDVIGISTASATARIRYGANTRPDPAIRPWPGGDTWQSPDIEIRNDRNAAHPEWFNMPWADHHNTIVATVRNSGPLTAPGVRVDFFLKDFAVSGAPEFQLDSVVKDVPGGSVPVEFTTDWFPVGEGHRCVIARIPLYQDPGNPAVVELSQLNNEAQSNYTRFISASSSPSSREVTQITVQNPYPARAKIAVVAQQSGPVAKYYRTYLEHTTLMLDPGEVRKVQVMFESLAGLPEIDAELRRTEFFKRFYSIDNRVSFIGLGYDPETRHIDSPEILGGANVAVKSGRATRFELFKGDERGVVRGRVVTVDNGSPATGGVLVTATIDSDLRKNIVVSLTLDAQGFFGDDAQLQRRAKGTKIGQLHAHYPGAFELAACDAPVINR